MLVVAVPDIPFVLQIRLLKEKKSETFVRPLNL